MEKIPSDTTGNRSRDCPTSSTALIINVLTHIHLKKQSRRFFTTNNDVLYVKSWHTDYSIKSSLSHCNLLYRKTQLTVAEMEAKH